MHDGWTAGAPPRRQSWARVPASGSNEKGVLMSEDQTQPQTGADAGDGTDDNAAGADQTQTQTQTGDAGADQTGEELQQQPTGYNEDGSRVVGADVENELTSEQQQTEEARIPADLAEAGAHYEEYERGGETVRVLVIPTAEASEQPAGEQEPATRPADEQQETPPA